jgi:hypothetical protein
MADEGNPTGGLLGDGGSDGGTPPVTGKYNEGDYRNGLSSEWQGHSAIQDIKTPDELVKSFVHAQTMIGADKADIIRRPKEDATPEAIKEFAIAMGMPETADGYGDFAGEFPENFGDMTDAVSEMKKTFHELEVPKALGDKLMTKFFESKINDFESGKQLVTDSSLKSEENLKAAWGEAYEQNVGIAKAALNQFDPDGGLKDVLKDYRLSSNEHLVKLFHEIGKRTLDSSMVMGISGGNMKMAPSEAKAKLDGMAASPEFISKLTSGDKSVADAANKERMELFNIAYPA